MSQEIHLVSEEGEPRRGTIGNQDTVGDICDCQFCGHTFNQAYGGYYIDIQDVEGEGAMHELFKEAAEDIRGRKWLGFKEEDIGAVCDSCSWTLQNKRTSNEAVN